MKCELCKEQDEVYGLTYGLSNGKKVHLECLVKNIKIIVENIEKENNGKVV